MGNHECASINRIYRQDKVSEFLEKHYLDLICRAHQIHYVIRFFAKQQLLTIFSAPDYCGEFDNAGGMLSVDETLIRSFQILKPVDKKKGLKNNFLKPGTPPRKGPSISQKTSQQANPAAFLSAPH
ncbi:hypothetical protein ZIOFF_010510 [Zingiber officinale]|uniref:protein-serine/threonine phosphatase n=1 Tax=Zingiber officinale TaxID=94328 RepID=A0A8J5HIX7_ZINOF|nr:hypothetical protein ZIOFF_010510 [Zingiber officinale]